MTDLKTLRSLCDAATDGEWVYFSNSLGCGAQIDLHDIAHCHGFYSHMDKEQEKANARFIAATDPQTVRALIDEIERLRNALKPFAELYDESKPYNEYAEVYIANGVSVSDCRAAQQALKGTDNGTN